MFGKRNVMLTLDLICQVTQVPAIHWDSQKIASLILIYDFADDLSFTIIIVDTTDLSYKQSNIFKEKITY